MIAVQSEIEGQQLAALLEATTRKRGRGEGDPVSAWIQAEAAARRRQWSAAAAASTSGRVAWRRREEAEIEAVVRMHCERLRVGLEEAGRRQRAAVAAAAEAEAGRRLAEKEVELVEVRRRGAELEETARRVAAEAQIWMGVARDHEATVAALRASIERALAARGGGGVVGACAAEEGNSRAAAAAAEDEGSCCYDGGEGELAGGRGGKKGTRAFGCRCCGEGEVSVLLLPCRHLCLCAPCESRVDTCPVCGSHRDASMRVVLQ